MGTLIAGRYEIVRPLGSGGMGHVFCARDQLLHRDVALKVFRSSTAAPEERWLAEARTAARVNHPGVACVYDVGVDQGVRFLVMELVPGQTLRAILQRAGRLAPAQAVALAARLADALEDVHRHGIVHCDVKPQNIVIAPDGNPRLVDFGIAQVGSSAGSGHAYGSALYAAPEQLRGGALDASTDVYALGGVLYHMLVGRPPFTGDTAEAVAAQRLSTAPPAPRTLNPGISLALESVVLTALASDPAQRFPSAAAFAGALRSLDERAAPPTAPMLRVPAISTPAPGGGASLACPSRLSRPRSWRLSCWWRSVLPCSPAPATPRRPQPRPSPRPLQPASPPHRQRPLWT